MDIKRKLSLFFHKLSLAWLSCMIFMVQGNLPALTSSHAIIATRTGAITGFLVVLMSFIPWKFHYKLPVLMFIGCFAADMYLIQHILVLRGVKLRALHYWLQCFLML